VVHVDCDGWVGGVGVSEGENGEDEKLLDLFFFLVFGSLKL